MIQLSNANGDILLSAPNGRIHFHSQYFSREAGGGGGELSAVGGGNGAGAGVTAGAQSTSFLSKAEAFGSGLYDGAVKPLVDTIRHPIHALEGIGHAIAHPIDTAGALAHAVKDGGAKALSGDPYAIGMALGTVSSLVVPGAGEAEAAEDAVRVGQVGKLAEASEAADVAKVAETAEAAKVAEAAKTAEVAADRAEITRLSDAGDIERAREILAPHVMNRDIQAIVDRLDVSAPENRGYLWSGNKEGAATYARTRGGVVLESTSGGRVIDNWNLLNAQFPWENGGEQLWGSISKKYADGLRGEVNALRTSSRPNGGLIYQKYEKPAVLDNLDNGLVTQLNELQDSLQIPLQLPAPIQ